MIPHTRPWTRPLLLALLNLLKFKIDDLFTELGLRLGASLTNELVLAIVIQSRVKRLGECRRLHRLFVLLKILLDLRMVLSADWCFHSGDADFDLLVVLGFVVVSERITLSRIKILIINRALHPILGRFLESFVVAISAKVHRKPRSLV